MRRTRASRRDWRRRRNRARLATALVPGAGRWSDGARTGATVSVVVVVVGLVGATAMVLRPGRLLELLSRPTTLTVVAILNAAVLAGRLLELRSVERRARASRPGGAPATSGRRRAAARGRSRDTVAVGLVVAVIAAPHLGVGAGTEYLRRTLDGLFVAPSVGDPADAAGRPAPLGAAGLGTGVALEPPERTDAGPAAIEPDDGTLDVLLIGLDAGAGRTGARNDANLVVSVDPNTARAALIGVPRNLVHVPLPGSPFACRCFPRPLFALYEHGWATEPRAVEGADPGAERVRDAVGALLGRRIDQYVVGDMSAFVELVDAVGGVEVDLTGRVVDDKSHPDDPGGRITVDLEPGRHRLDGSTALAYVRSRRDSDDYRRMERQRCVVGSALPTAAGLSPLGVVRALEAVRGRLTTDIAREALPALLRLARQVDRDDIVSLGVEPPRFIDGRRDGYPVPDVPSVRRAVERLHEEQPRDRGGRLDDGDAEATRRPPPCR